MERFPEQNDNKSNTAKEKHKNISFLLLPYYPMMVMCTNSEEWFHVDCQKISKSATDDEDIDFIQNVSDIWKISNFSKQI